MTAVLKSSVWSVFDTRPGWRRVRWFDERAYACAKAANGEYWEETITELKEFDFVECFQTPHGVTILLSFHPASCDQRISLTLHLTPTGCRVGSTAFAPSVDHCA